MRIRTILLVGAGVLAICTGPASAKDRSDRSEFRASGVHHYVRHSHRAMTRYSRVTRARVGSASGSESSDLMVAGNNPAKKYSARELDERAVKTGTLYQAGNNPAKRYSARQPDERAVKTGTLYQAGNNPAKRYKSVETTGASSGRTR